MKKATALISCYNEAQRIGKVLEALSASKNIEEIVVVDAASTDNSREVIKKHRCRLIPLSKKIGKGEAIRIGLKHVKTPITLLCDADIRGLKEEHIQDLLRPLSKEFAMCVGVRDRWGCLGGFVRKKVMRLAGERAILTQHLNNVLKNPRSNDWGLEETIHYYFRIKGLPFKVIVLTGVDDLPKWEKYDEGIAFHLREGAIVCKTYAGLYLFDYPKDKLRHKRKEIKGFIDYVRDII